MELRGTLRRGGRPIDPAAATQVLNAVLDSGITFIDTSIDYGGSEEHIGAAIAHRRDEYVLASKAGCPLEHMPEHVGSLPHDYSRGNIVAGVEQSLRRLRTDHLDLLQIHLSPSRQVIERDGVLETLAALRDSGKVRLAGISSTLPNVWDHLELGGFETYQVPFSALERDHEAVIGAAAEAGAGVIVRGGVAKGEPGVGQGSGERWAGWGVAALDDLLDGDTRTGFLLRYTISTPGVSTTIVGSLNPGHVRANARSAARGPLPADVYAEARRRVMADPPR